MEGPSTPSERRPAPQKSEENAEKPEFGALSAIPSEDVQTISHQLLLQREANWGDLLSAAPRTLCSLGQCFVIAWSEAADTMVQKKDPSISKFLRKNLVDCSDLGRAAFREAESKMKQVSMTIESIIEQDGAIDGILNCLSKENPIHSELSVRFDELKQLAQDCVDNTELVAEKFKVWKGLAEKINKAYTAAADGMISSMIKWLLALNLRFGTKKAISEEEGPVEPEEPGKDGKPPKKAPNIVNRSIVWNRWIPHVVVRILEIRRNKAQARDQNGPSRASTFTVEKQKDEKDTACDRLAKQQVDAQERFEVIEQQLRNMNPDENAVKNITNVLRACQDNLTELIGDIERLRGFFGLLHTLIGVIAQYHESAKSLGGSMESEGSKGWIATLNADVSKLCVHYTIAGDISSTYVTVSRKYIMPGVKQVDSLSQTRTQRGAIGKAVNDIADYSKEAQDKIRELADKVSQRRQNLRERLVITSPVPVKKIHEVAS